MQAIHTSYIKRLSDQTGKTYRDLESLWKKFEREVENDRMFDPNKFSHMRSTNGSIAQEVARRFEEFLVNPLGVETEEQNEVVDEVKDDLVADNIADEMEEDITSEIEGDITEELPVDEKSDEIVDEEINEDEKTPVNETEVEDSETESDDTPEIDMDDFDELTEI